MKKESIQENHNNHTWRWFSPARWARESPSHHLSFFLLVALVPLAPRRKAPLQILFSSVFPFLFCFRLPQQVTACFLPPVPSAAREQPTWEQSEKQQKIIPRKLQLLGWGGLQQYFIFNYFVHFSIYFLK